MKTYEERKNDCHGCRDGLLLGLSGDQRAHFGAPHTPHSFPCTAPSREDYEAELRAEIEKMERWEVGVRNIVTTIVGPRVPFEIADIVDRVQALRAAFDRIATVIQGAYVNGQLPLPSDAELADLIIAEYSKMRAERQEESSRASVAESVNEPLRDWIKAANQFAWAHERHCPRHDSEAACTCGLDSFLSRRRPFIESYKEELASARAAAYEQGKRADADNQQALSAIEAIVGDDFCEDLDMRQNDLSGDMAVAHRKLDAVYRIAHSHVTSHTCFDVHDDWRREADASPQPESANPDLSTQAGKFDSSAMQAAPQPESGKQESAMQSAMRRQKYMDGEANG